jgi:hypothetical protein
MIVANKGGAVAKPSQALGILKFHTGSLTQKARQRSENKACPSGI